MKLAMVKISGGVGVGIDKIIFIAIVYLIDNKRSVDRIISDLVKNLEVMCHTWIDDCLSA